jgi:peroxiredoxin
MGGGFPSMRLSDAALGIERFQSAAGRQYSRDDFFPNFDLPVHGGGRVRLDYYGGQCLAICLLPPASESSFGELLRHVRAYRSAIAEARLDMLFVTLATGELNEQMRARYHTTQRMASDPEGSLRRLLALTDELPTKLVTYLLDPALRVLEVYHPEEIQKHVLDLIKRAAPYQFAQPPIVIARQAPIATVSHVLPPDLCRELISLYRRNPTHEGMVGLGDRSRVNLQQKRRREYTISRTRDRAMLDRLDVVLQRTLLPELQKLYRTNLTHRERYKIACYSGSEQGHYNTHRDSSDPRQVYRRLSVSINLNDAFDGGYLNFPEYGSFLYRAAPGSAVVFPSRLLHSVTPVTRGLRYVVISFLFDDTDAEIKRKLREGHLDNDTPNP